MNRMENLRREVLSTWKFSYDKNVDVKTYELMRIALGIAGEAGELCEVIKKIARLRDTNGHKVVNPRSKLEEELADLFYYMIVLADRLGIDLLDALEKKMIENRRRYLR